ncbi:unnamed protein product [Echinostoma caproni]|uniref:Uncharacterized protein n=1 Tax=Echinostoma caproni TaxID=27848 RepID=A0A183ATZ7_9TREM|nr:unnamed protein product [Echinostoma caproni]
MLDTSCLDVVDEGAESVRESDAANDSPPLFRLLLLRCICGADFVSEVEVTFAYDGNTFTTVAGVLWVREILEVEIRLFECNDRAPAAHDLQEWREAFIWPFVFCCVDFGAFQVQPPITPITTERLGPGAPILEHDTQLFLEASLT